VLLKIQVLRDVMPVPPVNSCRRFQRSSCFHLQGQTVQKGRFWSAWPENEGVKTLRNVSKFRQSTRCNIPLYLCHLAPESVWLWQNRCRSPKSRCHKKKHAPCWLNNRGGGSGGGGSGGVGVVVVVVVVVMIDDLRLQSRMLFVVM
jgi:hypothetical protein